MEIEVLAPTYTCMLRYIVTSDFSGAYFFSAGTYLREVFINIYCLLQRNVVGQVFIT